MITFMSGAARWSERTAERQTHPCCLCKRRIKTGDKYAAAAWSVAEGVLVQAYHRECAHLIKLFGPAITFMSAEAVSRWAYDTGCEKCVNRGVCPINPFGCVKCLAELRYKGGMRDEPVKTEEYENAEQTDDNEILP